MKLETELARVDPTRVPAAEMTLPGELDLEFEGWTPEVYAMLDRLREEPHIEQYRKEKPGVTEYLKAPFKRYRNDLVVNWVLPNRLDLETEKNVFSRLLKNDFGAGGCKDNLWLSFYRPGRRRLTDVQVSHKISPDGFTVGIYVGGRAKDLVKQVKGRVASEPERFLGFLNPLLQEKNWRFYYRVGTGENRRYPSFEAPLDAIPDEFDRAKDLWIRHYFDRAEVLAWGPNLVRHALDVVFELWPIYRFYLEGERR